jgi:hypothetical protein
VLLGLFCKLKFDESGLGGNFLLVAKSPSFLPQPNSSTSPLYYSCCLERFLHLLPFLFLQSPLVDQHSQLIMITKPYSFHHLQLLMVAIGRALNATSNAAVNKPGLLRYSKTIEHNTDNQ